MDMTQIRRDSLITQVQLYGKLWGNQQLQEIVCQAVAENDMAALVDVVDKLATTSNEQRAKIALQAATIRSLQGEVDEITSALANQKQTASGMMKPPALKEDLETQKMWQLYQKYGSFSKVADLMGCATKTVSRRLRAEGYVK